MSATSDSKKSLARRRCWQVFIAVPPRYHPAGAVDAETPLGEPGENSLVGRHS